MKIWKILVLLNSFLLFGFFAALPTSAADNPVTSSKINLTLANASWLHSNDAVNRDVDTWVTLYSDDLSSNFLKDTYYDIQVFPSSSIEFIYNFDDASYNSMYNTSISAYGVGNLRIVEAYLVDFRGNVIHGLYAPSDKISFKGTCLYTSGGQRITLCLHVQGQLGYNMISGTTPPTTRTPFFFCYWKLNPNTFKNWNFNYNISNLDEVVDIKTISDTTNDIISDTTKLEQSESQIVNNKNQYITSDTFSNGRSDLDSASTGFALVRGWIEAYYNKLGSFKILINTWLIIAFCGVVLNIYRASNGKGKGDKP